MKGTIKLWAQAKAQAKRDKDAQKLAYAERGLYFSRETYRANKAQDRVKDQIFSTAVIPSGKYYVLSNDTFLSGWGHGQKKTNTLILVCDSLKQAEIVAENARNRSDQTHIRILSSMVGYRLKKHTHLYQLKTIYDYPSWYKAGFFA